MTVLIRPETTRHGGTHPGKARKVRKAAAKYRPKDSGARTSRRPLGTPYRRFVTKSLDVRRDKLAQLVARVVAHARREKGWTLKQLLEAADVQKGTYYRWVNKTWTEDLEPGHLERFFDAAGWAVSDAFDILWPGKYTKRKPTEPRPLSEEIALINRALEDPNTDPETLIVIKTTLDLLMLRIAPNAKARKRA